MAFVKTAWVDRSPPGITAAQLNRMEDGIADANGVTTDFNAQTVDYDITGLNGDTDMGYEVICIGRIATSGLVAIRPNGDAGNSYAGLYNQTIRVASGAVSNGVGATSFSGLQLSNNPTTTAYHFASRAVFFAKSQGGQYGRPWYCEWAAKAELTSGESLLQSVTQWWNPASAATVLNKLTVTFGGAFTGRINVKRIV